MRTEFRKYKNLVLLLNSNWWTSWTKYSKIWLIRNLKGIRKSDDLGEVTNYANTSKLYHSSSYTLS